MITLEGHLYGIYKGHRLRILDVKLKEFRKYNNPGAFDVNKFYKSNQIYLTGFIDDSSDIISFGKASNKYSFFEFIEKRKESFVRFIRSNLPFPNSEIYSALTIGEKKVYPRSLETAFLLTFLRYQGFTWEQSPLYSILFLTGLLKDQNGCF
ncbi:MAG: DUF4131 domain-containing protein [Candidatus Dadabacteria bacterium]|nr:DUF4131 domain-containing protein [Candidatus Dadabacteria bacterium]NIS07624.1 DUF4131 domain-containing protein [Candidatus Dadabacteria bacterium]NIV42078.1 DUF4131 domain-containing protein [Candidatus Dadabacteria bacterium]NIX16483.1 DUF4131 domain-containing protein [Candidatus Dadabacteria bacterium]NIY21262.1 DUF4131 domain-containing protein [Candidatus Dadabacteria bacterium]